MLKIFFTVTIMFGIVFCAQSQLTNQVLITPSLRFTLTNSSNGTATNEFNSNDEILFMVTSTDENGHVFALLRPEQSFIFELHDAKGNLVKKTSLGIENSQSVDINSSARELRIRHNPVSPNHAVLNNLFVPDDYFVITNKGIHTLDLQIRAWVQRTNNQYGIVISPPIRVEIDKR